MGSVWKDRASVADQAVDWVAVPASEVSVAGAPLRL